MESQARPSATTDDAEIVSLVAQLRSLKARKRKASRLALRRQGAAAVGPLVALLKAEAERRRRYRPLRFGFYTTYILLFLAWIQYFTSPVNWALIPVFILLLCGIAWQQAASPAQIEAAQLLAEIDDIRAVGPLAEALEFRDLARFSGTSRAAARALARLLPRLQAGDAGLVNEAQRACLYRALPLSPYLIGADLLCAILRAMAQIGDEKALPHVRRLANLRTARTDVDDRIREEARNCLATLLARIEGRRAPQMLLRAMGSAEAMPELLLRPAGAGPDPAPQQLLRSVSPAEPPLPK